MHAKAVIYVGNLDRMAAFYREGLGLTAADSGDGYCGLQSSAGLLTLVRSAEAVPSATPAPRRTQTPVKLAFEVPNIELLRNRLADLGGQLDPEDVKWEFRGSTHCDCVDPEGNVIQLVQAPTCTRPRGA